MGKTRWCDKCMKCQPIELNSTDFICCSKCGKVIDQNIYTEGPSFVQNTAGQHQLPGNIVRSIKDEFSASRELTLNKAHYTMNHVADNLGIQDGENLIRAAKALYTIALERNFTRGRNAAQVAASCLYIICREKKLPFLLIEVAEVCGVNVYTLGNVFIQLCELLHLQEHPDLKPVDPSLCIHRFTNVLLGRSDTQVKKTALRIMASMKRDWMQTGRKPSGLCGAALYIAALAHGHKFRKSDVVEIVHVCEQTLTKRLIEFEDTAFGSLSTEELNQNAEELERNPKSSKDSSYFQKCEKNELLCEHKGSELPHFAHGLCESCHEEFLTISGGLDGGADPPAFQHADSERKAKLHDDRSAPNAETGEGLHSVGSQGVGAKGTTPGADHDESEGAYHASTENVDESGNFSDIDDTEVNGYLHNEEETEHKKVIWEEQAAKEAAKKAELAEFQNCSPEELAARKFAAEVAAKTAESRKEQRNKRAAETKIPQTAAEAAHQMLKRKKISSRINYEVLENLFDNDASLLREDYSNSTKKSRTEPNPKNNGFSPIQEDDDTETSNQADDEWGTTVGAEHEDYYDGNAQDHNYYNDDDLYNDFSDGG